MAIRYDEEGNPVSDQPQDDSGAPPPGGPPDPTAVDQRPGGDQSQGSGLQPGQTYYAPGYDPTTGAFDPTAGAPPPNIGGTTTDFPADSQISPDLLGAPSPGTPGPGGGGPGAPAPGPAAPTGLTAADVAKQLRDALGKLGGMGGGWSEADFQAYMGYLQKQADVETQRYQQSFGLETSKFQAQKEQFQKELDLKTAIQNATQAYQTALIQTRNVELAQNAARDAMTRDFQMQDLEFRRQQNAANVSIEQEKLDLQRRLLPAARTTRRAATVQNI